MTTDLRHGMRLCLRITVDQPMPDTDIIGNSYTVDNIAKRQQNYPARPRRLSDALFRALTRWRITLLTQTLDIVVIIGIAALVYPMTARPAQVLPLQYLIGAGLVAVVSHFSFYQAGLYEPDRLQDPHRSLKSLFLRWTSVFMTLAAVAALAHVPSLFSRLWYGVFFAGGIAGLGVERLLIARLIHAWIERGHYMSSIAIVGENQLAAKLIARIGDHARGIRILGVFDDRSADRSDDRNQAIGAPRIGTIADLLDYSMTHEIDMVIVTLPIEATQRIQAVIRQLRQRPVDIRLLPGAIGLELISPLRLGRMDQSSQLRIDTLRPSRMELPGVQLLSVADRPLSDFAYFAKSAFDRTGAAIVLLLAAPILLVCVLGIKLNSPGPVFFRQKRIGYKGQSFEIYKFRSMHAAECGSVQATRRGDARVFGFGHFLRSKSLDELPQLINVLKGDMSLVGPRPHMIDQQVQGQLFLDAVTEYADRQRVKPGMTGWAQINGWRGPTDTIEQVERRVEHDIYYIENWSLLFDVLIILKTIFVGFNGKNAY